MNSRSIKFIPYLAFEGQCEEALNFYQSVLGGTYTVVNRYDNPAMQAPEEYHDKVLHSQLEIEGDIVLYACDTFPGNTTHKNSGDVSISVILHKDLEKARKVFSKLAEGGKVSFPFDKQFWGDWHGSLKDRYGMSWNINLEE